MILGVMQGYRANFNLGLQHFERARDLFQKLNNVNRMMTCVLNIGEIYRQMGDFNRAQRFLGEAYDMAVEEKNLRTQTIALANRGQALVQMGRYDEALELLEKAYLQYPEWGDLQNPDTDLLAELHHALARVYLAHGIVEAAWQQGKESYQMAQKSNKPMAIGFANRTMAEVLTALNGIPAEDAEQFPLDIDSYFQQAQQAFREIGLEGELARTMFAQAKSLSERGRRVQAARRLQQAIILFSKLGMVDDASKAAELQTEIF
jgi:tetratricopeptide (TPR) repeat protein